MGVGMADPVAGRVRERRVFYIPGYDPNPPRRYRELYRREAAAQAAISGHEISVFRPRGKRGPLWDVQARIERCDVHARYEVLAWSDLVQASMKGGIGATYAALFRTTWIYISSGTLRALMRLRKGPVIAALYPIVMLLVQAALALLAGWAAGAGLAALSRMVSGPGLGETLGRYAGWAVALPVALLALRAMRGLDRHLFAWYLMHDYAFSAGLRGANRPELDQRINSFADRVAAALDEPGVDEVLIVGHSSGVQLAVQMLARMCRDGRLPPTGRGPAVSFLSLGQSVPMISFLPEAAALRADLHDLARCETVFWLDVSAPADGCSFALCDPVAVSGVAPARRRAAASRKGGRGGSERLFASPPGPGAPEADSLKPGAPGSGQSGQEPPRRNPLVISAAFSQTLSESRWRALRWRFFQLHFQYLCAFDAPGDYDYFAITAGPHTLAARFSGRKPSASRIDIPVSPYRSVAA